MSSLHPQPKQAIYLITPNLNPQPQFTVSLIASAWAHRFSEGSLDNRPAELKCWYILTVSKDHGVWLTANKGPVLVPPRVPCTVYCVLCPWAESHYLCHYPGPCNAETRRSDDPSHSTQFTRAKYIAPLKGRPSFVNINYQHKERKDMNLIW